MFLTLISQPGNLGLIGATMAFTSVWILALKLPNFFSFFERVLWGKDSDVGGIMKIWREVITFAFPIAMITILMLSFIWTAVIA